MQRFPFQTGFTIAILALLLSGARLVTPAIRGPEAAHFSGIVDFAADRVPFSPQSRTPEAAAPVTFLTVHPMTAPLLVDSAGALDHFYEALWRSERRERGAVTHIVHYGDSPTTADLITGDIRAELQSRFGDGGHGFILAAKPWAWYQHSGVELTGSGWLMTPASRFQSHDGMFGLGGVSFAGSTTAHTAIVFDRNHTHFEAWYLQQPGGGAFELTADGKTLGRVETAAPAKSPGFAGFHVEAGASAVELHVVEGPVRLFGIAASNDSPGVVYDSLGLNGASITVLSKMYNEAHWAEELQHRHPDLVVVNYGTNEADFAAFVDGGYEKELRESLRRIRAAVPEASILIMAPMDRGYRVRPGEIETMPTIPRIVAIQRRVAQETGCGFFDTFTAMGGEGTMARWYNSQPRLVSADFIHPYPAGGRQIATIFTKQIELGLGRFKLRK